VTLTGHTDVPSKDENALKAAVSKQPVSVAIEADRSVFQLYAGGVLTTLLVEPGSTTASWLLVMELMVARTTGR